MPPNLDTPPPQPEHEIPVTETDYPVSPPPPKKRRWLIPIIVLAVIALLGLAWKLIPSKNRGDNPTPSSQIPTETDQTENKAPAGSDVPDPGSQKEYSNGFLGLKLMHPDTWSVTEAENGVRIESPSFTYQTDTKGSVDGYFRIYIRKGARSVDGGYIGRGYAIEPSQKLTYSNPAPGQRTDTNLTLFGLDEPTNFAYFMIAGNFSLKKGDTLGPDYGKEPDTYIIAGGFSEKSLTDDLATNPVDPELLKTSKAYAQALDIVKSLNLR